MKLSDDVVNWVANLAPRILLQKALLYNLTATADFQASLIKSFPLSGLIVPVPVGYQYQSAIAHSLAATDTRDADTLAHHLAQAIAGSISTQSGGDSSAVVTLMRGLQLQATGQGYLLITLAPEAIAGWLQHVHDAPAPTVIRAIGDEPRATLEIGSWPLCDRLHLSLPMLLQWAYSRCATWLGQLASLDADIKTNYWSLHRLMATESFRGHSRNSSSTHDTLTGHLLLPTLMRALDQMATRPQVKTGLGQGYAIAAAIYEFDAATPLGRFQHLSVPARVNHWSTLTVIQKVLAVIITQLFGMTPRSHL
ncbi:MAG: hypothetical protein AAGH67_06320 [Cyanobacteria bacterium P01_H01_bin.162]